MLCLLAYGYDLGIYWLFKEASNGSGLTASILSKISTLGRSGALSIFLKYPTSTNVSALQTALAVLCFGSRGTQILYAITVLQ